MLRTFSFELLGSVLSIYPSVFYNVSGLHLYICVVVIFFQSSFCYLMKKIWRIEWNFGSVIFVLEWLPCQFLKSILLCHISLKYLFFDIGILQGGA